MRSKVSSFVSTTNKSSHYRYPVLLCFICSIPLFIWFICVFVLLSNVQSASTTSRTTNNSNAGLNFNIPGLSDVTLSKIHLSNMCNSDGTAKIYIELKTLEELIVPFAFSLGHTSIQLKHFNSNQPIATLTTIPATGEWKPYTSNLAFSIPGKTNIFATSKIGLSIQIQDEASFYKLFQETYKKKRTKNAKDTNDDDVAPLSIGFDVKTALHLTNLMGTAIYIDLTQNKPIPFPIETAPIPPKSKCTSCRDTVEQEKKRKINDENEDNENTPTSRLNSTVNLGTLQITEISSSVFNFFQGIKLSLLNITGNSNFVAEIKATIGMQRKEIGIIKLGILDSQVAFGLHLTSQLHENNIMSFLSLLTTASEKRTITDVLPIHLSKATAILPTSTSTAPSTAPKCMLKDVLEALNVGSTIPVLSIQKYQDKTFAEIQNMNTNSVDVCQWSDTTDNTCTLPRPKPKPFKPLSPSPSSKTGNGDGSRGGGGSSGGNGGGNGGFGGINLNLIPNSIKWLESTDSSRSDIATIQFSWTKIQTESLFPGSTLSKDTNGKYMFETVTAPFVFEEKFTSTTLSISIDGNKKDGGLIVKISFCLNGKCNGSSNGPADSADSSTIPILLRNVLNGKAMNVSMGMASDSNVFIFGRIISLFNLSWYVPDKDFAGSSRARYFDSIFQVTSPETSASALMLAKWTDPVTVIDAARVAHVRTINVPSIVAGLLPSIDLGDLTISGLPYNNQLSDDTNQDVADTWITPVMNLLMKGSTKTTFSSTTMTLTTNVEFLHPKNEEVGANIEEYGLWSKILQCEKHTILIHIKHRGLNLKFPWTIPQGILGYDQPLLTQPSLTNSLFRSWTDSNTCSVAHTVQYSMNNPTPFDLSVLQNENDQACILLANGTANDDVSDVSPTSVTKNYALGCASGTLPGSSAVDPSFQVLAFENNTMSTLHINTTSLKSTEASNNQNYNSKSATTATSGTGCVTLHSEKVRLRSSRSSSDSSDSSTASSVFTTNNNWYTSSKPFQSSIVVGSKRTPNSKFIIERAGNLNMTVPPLFNSCKKVSKAIEDATHATSPTLGFAYDAILKNKILPIETINVETWNNDIHGEYGAVNISDLLDVQTSISIGGVGFVFVLLCFSIGCFGCLFSCGCLCYRDGCGDGCPCACPGCGQGRLPWKNQSIKSSDGIGQNSLNIERDGVEMGTKGGDYEVAPSNDSIE